jgi:hypothetical protein
MTHGECDAHTCRADVGGLCAGRDRRVRGASNIGGHADRLTNERHRRRCLQQTTEVRLGLPDE